MGQNDDHIRQEDEDPSRTLDAVKPLYEIGSRIGRFRIEQEMGRGGMGVVYLAQDTNLGRPVAIKTLAPQIGENRELLSRLRREAKILASLNHPNIATIYEELQEGGISYLVLEYIAGDTLTDRLRRGPLPLAEALSISLQVAEALSAAHNQSVVHRDLKPGNIKITPEGKVKVLDFGLAKAMGSQCPAPQSIATEPGKMFGTPAYMSPEQARAQEVDSRGDIWSFGCVLYEMLAGELPFKGETTSDTLANILTKEPNWHALPASTPPNIQVLLRRCLEKDPRSRLQNMGDGVIEIRETLSPPPAAPPAIRPGLPKPGVVAKASSRRVVMVLGAAILVVVAGVAAWLVARKPSAPPAKEIRLVVLPFENLGPAEDEYFAAGITDAITARLAVIHGLAVISRQSAMQYKKREKTAQQIADDLQVDYILEGTVQRERPSDPTSRVRIIPQLIKASSDTHVWAPQPYDNDISEVFRVQSDVAERVAQGLNIALIERERQALQSRPTENMEAYNYFLRGNEYRHGSEQENDMKAAIQMYERAVELDPKFALAYAWLSRCHAVMYWMYYDRTEERLAMAKKAVDIALQLEPDLAEAHLASGGYYYHCELDWDLALQQYAIARKSKPNDSELLGAIGAVQRRQGKLEEALVNFKRASELDPLNNHTTVELGNTFACMRNYPEAMRCYDKAISLAPDLARPYNSKAWLYLRWEGSTRKARAVVGEALKNIRSPEESSIVNLLIELDVYEGNYQKALDRLPLKSEDIDDLYDFVPTAMRRAQIYRHMNENELAKKYYDKGRSILEAKIQQEPNDARFRSSLGIAYAGLGRKEDAIREGELAVQLLPLTKDALRGYSRRTDLAHIHVMVGDLAPAMDEIEFLLSIPGDLSIPLLRLHPDWAPLREHPRFKKLVGTTE